MFEKEAEEIANKRCHEIMCYGHCSFSSPKHHRCGEWHREYECALNGAEFGYNKAKEEAMMKLKDEGIVKPLKDSILRNERLSSQEQQELCAWIECAMEFGEKLDECAKEREEAKKANEWHKPSEKLPEECSLVLAYLFEETEPTICEYVVSDQWECLPKRIVFCSNDQVRKWQEIVLPELPKESE